MYVYFHSWNCITNNNFRTTAEHPNTRTADEYCYVFGIVFAHRLARPISSVAHFVCVCVWRISALLLCLRARARPSLSSSDGLCCVADATTGGARV